MWITIEVPILTMCTFYRGGTSVPAMCCLMKTSDVGTRFLMGQNMKVPCQDVLPALSIKKRAINTFSQIPGIKSRIKCSFLLAVHICSHLEGGKKSQENKSPELKYKTGGMPIGP